MTSEHATKTAGTVTYQAAFSPDEQTVTVVRDVWAGVCGPAGDYPAADRVEAAAVLFAAGYLVAGAWTVSSIGDHWVALTPLF
jgi:hypothetical protein